MDSQTDQLHLQEMCKAALSLAKVYSCYTCTVFLYWLEGETYM